MTPELLHGLVQVWAFVLALCVGSFLNVVIARLPDDRSVVRPASHCPSCGHQIRWYENIPVLSWVFLRAKCSNCGSRISALYPAVELLTAVLGLLLFRRIAPDALALTLPNFAAWAVYLVFISMLIATTLIDLKHYIIPDQMSVYAVPVGLGAVLLLSWLGYDGHLAITWKDSVLGALLGGGVLAALIGLWWVVRRVEAMGFGDVKLLAMMGAFLGALPAVPTIVLVSALAGSAIGIAVMIRKGRGLKLQIPFGPFLAIGALLYVFFGDAILTWWFPSVDMLQAG